MGTGGLHEEGGEEGREPGRGAWESTGVQSPNQEAGAQGQLRLRLRNVSGPACCFPPQASIPGGSGASISTGLCTGSEADKDRRMGPGKAYTSIKEERDRGGSTLPPPPSG